MINWAKDNFMVLIFLAAIVASFVVAQQESANRDRDLVKAAVSVCARTSNGTAYDVVFKFRLARAARKQSEDKLASDIESYARGKLRTLPAPPSFSNDEAELRTLIDTERKDGRIVLTKEATALQRQGCRALFEQRFASGK